MRALFLSNDPSIFDATSGARKRMRAYAAAIGELHILSRAPRGGVFEDGPLTLHGMQVPKLLSPLALAARAKALIRAHDIEVVSAQDPFEHGWAAADAVRDTAAKLHIQVHTDLFSPWFLRDGMDRAPRVPAPSLNRVRLRIAGRVLPQVQGVRAVSKRVADSLVARYPKIPVPSVLPIFVSDEEVLPVPLPAHRFSFVLMAISRLEREKRIDDIIHALARASLHVPDAGLMIIGDGRERRHLEERVRKLGLDGRVLFLGHRDDARGLLRNANAFIQASAYEGYGRTLVEAALARVPIITTDVGIVGEVLRGYEECLVAPVADPAALATHIRGLVADHHARSVFAMKAEEAVKRHLGAYGDQPRLVADDLARTLETR